MYSFAWSTTPRKKIGKWLIKINEWMFQFCVHIGLSSVLPMAPLLGELSQTQGWSLHVQCSLVTVWDLWGMGRGSTTGCLMQKVHRVKARARFRRYAEILKANLYNNLSSLNTADWQLTFLSFSMPKCYSKPQFQSTLFIYACPFYSILILNDCILDHLDS